MACHQETGPARERRDLKWTVNDVVHVVRNSVLLCSKKDARTMGNYGR